MSSSANQNVTICIIIAYLLCVVVSISLFHSATSYYEEFVNTHDRSGNAKIIMDEYH